MWAVRKNKIECLKLLLTTGQTSIKLSMYVLRMVEIIKYITTYSEITKIVSSWYTKKKKVTKFVTNEIVMGKNIKLELRYIVWYCFIYLHIYMLLMFQVALRAWLTSAPAANNSLRL